MTEKQIASSSLEIERKFLVAEVPTPLDRYPHEAIRQGYLALDEDGTEVRVRQKGDRLYQTVKRGGSVQRIEVEILLTGPQFDALWPMTEGKRVAKTRYAMAYEAAVIELDVYGGALAGLVTAEVEFPSLAACTAFQPPSWFGRDISDDAAYKNRNLAVCGLPR